MAFEIEIKAHVMDDEVDSILEILKSLKDSEYLGEIHKDDIYWGKNVQDKPLFRTRIEDSDEGRRILFTSKPSKEKINGTEINVENEFETQINQKEAVFEFVKGLGLVICRRKFKSGYHFNIRIDDLEFHCELLNVRYLGWFIETEITLEIDEKEKVERCIYRLLEIVNVPKDRIEPTGYNKMLTACGHEKG